jgi:hypothetical protein
MAHTRPGGGPEQYNFAHPFITEGGRFAGLTNGTERFPGYKESVQRATDYLEDRGYSFHGGTSLEKCGFPRLKNGNFVSCVEARANLVEAYVQDGMDIPSAMARVASECYTDSVQGILSLDTPDRFYINRITRPAYALKHEHGMAVASCKFAFPDDEAENAERLPVMRPCIISKNSFTVSNAVMANCEPVSPLTEEAINVLYLQKLKNSTFSVIQMEWRDTIFLCKKGTPIKNSTYDTMLFKLCEKANIPKFSMHVLRHTFATRCIEAGMKPKTLQTILGHSNIGITMNRYVHTTEDEKLLEMDSIADKLKVV